MKTVAIYEQTPEGMLRLGTFTPRKFYSARAIADQFREKNPNINAPLFMSRRILINGEWTDDAERIPLQ